MRLRQEMFGRNRTRRHELATDPTGISDTQVGPCKNRALSTTPGEALDHERELRALRECQESLTPREREVMALVVSGKLNKQVGAELGISEITVKAHRGHMMRKMKADSLPDLVTLAARLRPEPAPKD